MIEAGDGAGFGQIGFGVFGPGHQLAVRHLDGHETLQLLVVGQVDEAEAAFAQDSLDPVATDSLGLLGGRLLGLRLPAGADLLVRGRSWGKAHQGHDFSGFVATGILSAVRGVRQHWTDGPDHGFALTVSQCGPSVQSFSAPAARLQARLPAILASFPRQAYAIGSHLHPSSRTMSFTSALSVLRPTLPYYVALTKYGLLRITATQALSKDE